MNTGVIPCLTTIPTIFQELLAKRKTTKKRHTHERTNIYIYKEKVFIYVGIVDVDAVNASIHAGCEIPMCVSSCVKWWVCAKIQHFYPTSPQYVVER